MRLTVPFVPDPFLKSVLIENEWYTKPEAAARISQQLQQNPALRGSHLRRRQSRRRSDVGFAGFAFDLLKGLLLISGFFLIVVEGLEQFHGEVVRLRQGPRPFPRSILDGRRVGTKE